ncbi:hypothetical protein ACOME3_001535 [Neoechinorhynchus agilis]
MPLAIAKIVIPLLLANIVSSKKAQYAGCYGIDEDDQMREVDWFAIVKLPKLNHTQINNEWLRQGLGFLYIDSEDANKWRLIKDPISRPDSFLMKTIDRENELSTYAAYNDQPSLTTEGTNNEHGHVKGVYGFAKSGGFWLVHSIPHFPMVGNISSYPDSGKHYGQHLFCLSLPPNIEDNIKTNIISYLNPHFSINKSDSNQKLEERKNCSNHYTISTLNNLTVNVFAKAPEYKADIYVDILTRNLRDDVLVQTWTHSPDYMNSDCDGHFKVENIKSSQVQNLSTNESSIGFPSSSDHSKWALLKNQRYVCFGDLNRVTEHITRAGGLYCINHDKLWSRYSELIFDVDACVILKKQRSKSNAETLSLVYPIILIATIFAVYK